MSWALARINWMKYLSVGWSHSPCSHNANTRQTIQIWERETFPTASACKQSRRHIYPVVSWWSRSHLADIITAIIYFLIRAVIVVLLSLSTARLEDEICLSYSESCCYSSLLSPVYWQWQELVTSCDPDSYNSLRGLTFRVSKRNSVWCLLVQRVLQDLVHCCHNMSECRHLHPTNILSPASMK